jgi:hypothetical protein
MKVKIVNPDHAVGLRDPHTKRSPFLDKGRPILGVVDVPDNSFWNRRLLAGEVVRSDEQPPPSAVERTAPTGSEPVALLTTRSK